MDQKALFMKFWEKEAAATRKVIERIPQDTSDYRADPKARTAREIAWLMVREEIVLGSGLDKGKVEWEEIPTPATVKEILDDLRCAPWRGHEDAPSTANIEVGSERAVPLAGPGIHARERLRQRVGIPARSDPPSRATLDVPSADGLDGAGDLRAERG